MASRMATQNTMFDPERHLNRNDLERLGIEGWPFGIRDRVRFSELDALNHVNNAVYFSWLETARIAYLLDYGLTGMTHVAPDPQIVVRRQTVDYLAPIHFGETYVAAMRTARIKPSSLVMDYAIFVDGTVRATAETVIVALTQDASARQNWRAEAVTRMIELDGAEAVGFE